MPLACFTEPLELSNTSLRVPPASFLRTAWPNPTLDGYFENFRRQGLRAEKWDCGHDAMLERPDDLARLLLQLAGDDQACRPLKGS